LTQSASETWWDCAGRVELDLVLRGGRIVPAQEAFRFHRGMSSIHEYFLVAVQVSLG
jgi:hypothetical protein